MLFLPQCLSLFLFFSLDWCCIVFVFFACLKTCIGFIVPSTIENLKWCVKMVSRTQPCSGQGEKHKEATHFPVYILVKDIFLLDFRVGLITNFFLKVLLHLFIWVRDVHATRWVWRSRTIDRVSSLFSTWVLGIYSDH